MHRPCLSAILLACLCVLPLRADEATDKLDEAVLKEAKQATDGPGLLKFFRDRTLSDARQAAMTENIRRLGHDNHAVRDKASLDLIASGRPARSFLKQALDNPDLEIAHRASRCLEVLESSAAVSQEISAARLLGSRKPDGAAVVILGYLPFADDELVEDELVSALVATGLREGKAEAEVVHALNDALVLRRSAAALVVGRSSAAEQRALVRGLLKDKDAKVRFRASLGLLAAREKEGIAGLLPLLADGPREIAWQAEEVLVRLAGDQAPAVSVGGGAEGDRAKCRQAWEAWWRERGGAIDLAKLELEQRSLGLTLILAFDGYGAQGKIWETRADGKARWEMRDVQAPIDAHVLPGNRVLIAEHNGRRVTERDLTGKVLWEYTLGNNNQYPVSCQRLPNGNTFIATYNNVMEVTPDRKQVYSYACGHGIIYSAQKMRNGQIVFVASDGSLILLDDKGKEVKQIKLGPVGGWLTVDALPGGRFLVPQPNGGKVVELDSEGRTVATYNAANVNAASKLPNGNILICRHNDRAVAEVDKTGKEIWVQKLEGRPFWARRR